MGDCWTAPAPRCPVHGQMSYRPPHAGRVTGNWACDLTGSWVCNGWDGEGCDYQAPPLAWTRIGDVTGLRFTITRPVPSGLGGDR